MDVAEVGGHRRCSVFLPSFSSWLDAWGIESADEQQQWLVHPLHCVQRSAEGAECGEGDERSIRCPNGSLPSPPSPLAAPSQGAAAGRRSSGGQRTHNDVRTNLKHKRTNPQPPTPAERPRTKKLPLFSKLKMQSSAFLSHLDITPGPLSAADDVRYVLVSKALDLCMVSVYDQIVSSRMLYQGSEVEDFLFEYVTRRRLKQQQAQLNSSSSPLSRASIGPGSSCAPHTPSATTHLTRRASAARRGSASARLVSALIPPFSADPSSLLLPPLRLLLSSSSSSVALPDARRLSILLGDAGLEALCTALQPDDSLRHRSYAAPLEAKIFNELAASYLDAIRLSNTVSEAVAIWFDNTFPQKLDGSEVSMDIVLANIRHLLVAIGALLRPALRMSRIGFGMKILVSLALTYADIMSDIRVTEQYWYRGMDFWFKISVALILTSILTQALLMYLQYRPGGVRRWLPRVLLSLCGLSHLYQGILVWSGNDEKTDLTQMDSSDVMFALKGSEVAMESLGQGVCQIIAILTFTDDVPPVFAVSICLSFLSIGFAMTEATISMGRTFASNFPGDPHFQWCPGVRDTASRVGLFFTGVFLFNAAYCFLFVSSMASLFFVFGSFQPVLYLLLAEYSFLTIVKFSQDELVGSTAPYLGHPSLDNFVAAIYFAVTYLLAAACPLAAFWHPLLLGPLYTTSIVLYRYVACGVICYFAAPHLESRTWLTARNAVVVYAVAAGLSLAGLALAVFFVRPGFDRGLLWKHRARKDWGRWNLEPDNNFTLEQQAGIHVGYEPYFGDQPVCTVIFSRLRQSEPRS